MVCMIDISDGKSGADVFARFAWLQCNERHFRISQLITKSPQILQTIPCIVLLPQEIIEAPIIRTHPDRIVDSLL